MLKYLFLGLMLLGCLLACQSDVLPVFYGRVKYIKYNNVLRFEFLYDQHQRLKEWRGYLNDGQSVHNRTTMTRNDIGQVIASESWSMTDISSSDAAKPGDPLILRWRKSYEYNTTGQMVKAIDLINYTAPRLTTTEYRYSTVGGVSKTESLNEKGEVNSFILTSPLVNNQQIVSFYNADSLLLVSSLTEYDDAINPFYDPSMVINFIPTDCVKWQHPNNESAIYQVDIKGNKIGQATTRFEITYNARYLPIKKTMFYANTTFFYEFLYE